MGDRECFENPVNRLRNIARYGVNISGAVSKERFDGEIGFESAGYYAFGTDSLDEAEAEFRRRESLLLGREP